MSFRIISLPPFKAISSGVDRAFDFSEEGILGRFDRYFSTLKPWPRDDFMPRDFLFYDPVEEGMVWCYAVCEDYWQDGRETSGVMETSFQWIDFEGGYYLTYCFRDGDDREREQVHQEAVAYIESSTLFEMDERPDHYSMGHIITPPEIIRAQGYAQMEVFIPIRLIQQPA